MKLCFIICALECIVSTTNSLRCTDDQLSVEVSCVFSSSGDPGDLWSKQSLPPPRIWQVGAEIFHLYIKHRVNEHVLQKISKDKYHASPYKETSRTTNRASLSLLPHPVDLSFHPHYNFSAPLTSIITGPCDYGRPPSGVTTWKPTNNHRSPAVLWAHSPHLLLPLTVFVSRSLPDLLIAPPHRKNRNHIIFHCLLKKWLKPSRIISCSYFNHLSSGLMSSCDLAPHLSLSHTHKHTWCMMLSQQWFLIKPPCPWRCSSLCPAPPCFIHCRPGTASLVWVSLHASVISSDGMDSMDCSFPAHLSPPRDGRCTHSRHDLTVTATFGRLRAV